MDQPPTIQIEEADDAQGMIYIWMCPLCGQPMKEGERCNSGIHQGPNDGNDNGPLSVRSIDLVRGMPIRGDAIEAWLKRMRARAGQYQSPSWNEVDRLVDRWRECSDYGLSLQPEDDERGDP